MNPTKPATYERRALSGIEVREADKASGFIGHLTGYAAMFNSDSLDMGGWTERIAPGAFKRSLAESPDILSFWSHNKDVPVGRTPDTLRVSEDDKGLRFELDLVDTEANRSLLTNVRAKIVRGAAIRTRAAPRGASPRVTSGVSQAPRRARSARRCRL